MSEVKRNHHLPRFYLDAWADQDGQIVLRRRGGGKAAATSVGNAAVKNRLYTQNAESLLGATETAAAPIIRSLLHDTGVIDDPENRRVLSQFMAELMARQRYMGTFMGLTPQMYCAVLEANPDPANTLEILRGEFGPDLTLRDAERVLARIEKMHANLGEKYPEKTMRQIQADVLAEAASPDFSRSLQSYFVEGEDSDRILEEFSKSLRSRQWLVCRSTGSEFITSDQPVFKHPTWLDRDGIGPHDTLCFVVSPTLLLKMGDESGHRRWGEKEVHELNLYIAKHCDHQIIATPANEDYLGRIRLGKHRPWGFARSSQPPRVPRRVAS